MPAVTIYSTPTCPFCHQAKEFFAAQGIEFTDYNVAENDEKREEMVEKTGQFGVPVIEIGSEVIIGFDKERIVELLQTMKLA